MLMFIGRELIFVFCIKCCHRSRHNEFECNHISLGAEWIARIVSNSHEANMNSAAGIAIILGVTSMMVLASPQTNETVRTGRFPCNPHIANPIINWTFAVASRCDSRSICIVRSSWHIEWPESYRQWQFGDESTISMVCFGASVHEPRTAIGVRRLVAQRWMGTYSSALRTWLHHIQYGIRFTESQSSVHIVDVAAYHRASALQSAHLEQRHRPDQTADANYFHAIRATDSIADTDTGN